MSIAPGEMSERLAATLRENGYAFESCFLGPRSGRGHVVTRSREAAQRVRKALIQAGRYEILGLVESEDYTLHFRLRD